MAKEDRGFRSMSPEKQREIASMGGKAAHAQGAAHEWTSEEARIAGSWGGKHFHMIRKGVCPECKKALTTTLRCATCEKYRQRRLGELRQKYAKP